MRGDVTMFCKKCGAVVNEGETACPVCGACVNEPPAPAPVPLPMGEEFRRSPAVL